VIVVDTNVISYFFLAGERTECIVEVFDRDPYWIAPVLWKSEFRSVLTLYIRKRILGIEDAVTLAGHVESFMKGNEYAAATESVLGLSVESGCSSYDCEFVALAVGMDVPLVTTDKKIIRAFPRIALPPEAFCA
jgi:predicted nucleic acid-binding protein